MTKLPIFNLQFRRGCNEMDIAGYKFERVSEYRERQGELQHMVNSRSEFETTIQDGKHTHTAYVTLPEQEEKAILPWANADTTALEDIIMLLSLFTNRDVFQLEQISTDNIPTIASRNHRLFYFGGILACSLKYHETGKELHLRITTIQENLNAIYQRMQNIKWQQAYKNGYYLALARMAIQQNNLEAAFTQCWTIWEHLFACINDKWMSNTELRRIGSKEKISFLIVHFEILTCLSEEEKRRIEDLVKIRNRLIHYGVFPEGSNVQADAFLFVRLTEYMIAKSIGLTPSEIYSTFSKLERFLKDEGERQIW